MCGIIGYIGSQKVVPILIDGLRRLEYRGYDSAGVAVVRNGAIDLRRSAGKLARLEEVIATTPIEGDYGIGHTRWATHGRPTEENAHPHRDCARRVAFSSPSSFISRSTRCATISVSVSVTKVCPSF